MSGVKRSLLEVARATPVILDQQVEAVMDGIKQARKDGERVEVVLKVGSSYSHLLDAGTVIIVPKKAFRENFPLLWATEKNKYNFPKLLQVAGLSVPSGPSEAETFAFSNWAKNRFGAKMEEQAELVDEYLDTLDGDILLYLPKYAAFDRVKQRESISSDSLEEKVNSFLRKVYGYYAGQETAGLQKILQRDSGTAEETSKKESKKTASASPSLASTLDSQILKGLK